MSRNTLCYTFRRSIRLEEKHRYVKIRDNLFKACLCQHILFITSVHDFNCVYWLRVAIKSTQWRPVVRPVTFSSRFQVCVYSYWDSCSVKYNVWEGRIHFRHHDCMMTGNHAMSLSRSHATHFFIAVLIFYHNTNLELLCLLPSSVCNTKHREAAFFGGSEADKPWNESISPWVSHRDQWQSRLPNHETDIRQSTKKRSNHVKSSKVAHRLWSDRRVVSDMPHSHRSSMNISQVL
jgi:hypothetical protein